jgi:hypothetical protein
LTTRVIVVTLELCDSIKPSRQQWSWSLPRAPRKPSGVRVTPIEQYHDSTWAVQRAWTPTEEQAYGRFVTAIGRGVAEHRCRGLAQCLDNPAVNPLHIPGRRMRFQADCADVAYLLRAYYAWRRELPFVFVNGIRWQRRPEAGGRALDTRPVGLARWDAFQDALAAAPRARGVG